MTKLNKPIAILLIAQFILMWAAVYILGGATEWPQSLDWAPELLLKIVAENPVGVRWGYVCYLLSSVLFAPIAVLIFKRTETRPSSYILLATTFGVAAVFFKSIGILRWLTVQPLLAAKYNLSPDRADLVLIFDSINKYFGAIGENLGVMLGMGLWTIFFGMDFYQQSNRFRVLPVLGVGLGISMVVGVIELVGIQLPGWYLTATGAGWQLWSLALAIHLWKNK